MPRHGLGGDACAEPRSVPHPGAYRPPGCGFLRGPPAHRHHPGCLPVGSAQRLCEHRHRLLPERPRVRQAVRVRVVGLACGVCAHGAACLFAAGCLGPGVGRPRRECPPGFPVLRPPSVPSVVEVQCVGLPGTAGFRQMGVRFRRGRLCRGAARQYPDRPDAGGRAPRLLPDGLPDGGDPVVGGGHCRFHGGFPLLLDAAGPAGAG